MLGACRDDQMIEIDAKPFRSDLVSFEVDMRNPGQDHGGILLVAKNPPDRGGDVGGRQAGGSHLIEQRLKQMIIVPIDHDHVERRIPQRLGGGKARKTCADDHDALAMLAWIVLGHRALLIFALGIAEFSRRTSTRGNAKSL